MALNLGPHWERAIWSSPYRLRFELNQGGAYVNRFAVAYDRARTLARGALPTNNPVAVIAAYPRPRAEIGAKRKGWMKGTAFEILAEMGVPTSAAETAWSGYFRPNNETDEDCTPLEHRAVPVTWDQADILLWNQIAHDIGVAPQAPVNAKLVDLERGVVVHAYDDRGLDVTALGPTAISDLYRRFDSWLLDYDRPRMASAFVG